MKIKALTICSFFALLFLFSCGDDDSQPDSLPADYVSSFIGEINFTPWESDVQSASSSDQDANYEIIASGQPSNPNHEYTTISIYFDSLEVGSYNIGFEEEDVSVIYNGVLDNTASFEATGGTFTINLHDADNKRVAGTIAFSSLAVGFSGGVFDLIYE